MIHGQLSHWESHNWVMAFPSMTQGSLCNSRRACVFPSGQVAVFTSPGGGGGSYSWKPDQPGAQSAAVGGAVSRDFLYDST